MMLASSSKAKRGENKNSSRKRPKNKETEREKGKRKPNKKGERERERENIGGKIFEDMPISKIEVQKHERCLPSNDNFNKLHSSEPNLATNIYNIGYEKYQLRL